MSDIVQAYKLIQKYNNCTYDRLDSKVLDEPFSFIQALRVKREGSSLSSIGAINPTMTVHV